MSESNIKFSVVIPCYKCASSIEELYKRLTVSLGLISENFEILFVNDSSPHNDWEIIFNLTQLDQRVKGINFSRNFGQHYAITAGLENATGDWIVVMDGDLQDRPEEIPNLYAKANTGFEIVFAQRINRQDSFLKRLSSNLFYKVFSYLTETDQDSSIANFGIYKRNVIDAVLSMKDNIKYFPTMSQWVGFRKTKQEVEHSKREDGKSSYSLKSLLNLAFNNIIAFSNKPLKLVVKLGFSIVIFSILIAIYYVIKSLMGEIVILGYSSLIVSIWFLFGVNISILGIVGIYIGKIFEKIKNRPTYIVMDKINF